LRHRVRCSHDEPPKTSPPPSPWRPRGRGRRAGGRLGIRATALAFNWGRFFFGNEPVNVLDLFGYLRHDPFREQFARSEATVGSVTLEGPLDVRLYGAPDTHCWHDANHTRPPYCVNVNRSPL